MTRRILILALLLELAAGLSAQGRAKPGFAPLAIETIAKLESFFDDPRFAHAHWGVLIQSLDSGQAVVARNADRLFIPASNQKLLTGAAALLSLGPGFRFRTAFRVTGNVVDEVLDGDLVVAGDGDPSLYTRFGKETLDVFRTVAARLKEMGIGKIAGSVIGDDDAFDDVHVGHGMTLENLPHHYAAQVGALQLNENYVDLVIRPPAEAGAPVEVAQKLPTRYLRIDNRLVAVASGTHQVAMERQPGSNLVTLRGRVRAGKKPFERAPSIHNPTLFYATVLREVLEAKGIAVAGSAIDVDDMDARPPAPGRTVHVHLSPPLSQLLAVFLKRSQNLYGETLVRAMGLKVEGRGTFEAGRKVVRRTLEPLGLAPSAYAYLDGSGLSRYDLVSPRLLVTLLAALRKEKQWPVWRDALPIAGKDGTLGRRMKGTAAEGRVIAKTGTVSNVRALSGYATTKDGETYVFSFLVNSHRRTNRETEEVTDGALALLTAVDRR